MAGLYLNGDLGIGSAASAPPSGPSTITSRAFGVDSGVAAGAGPKTAGLGATGVGVVATVLLVFIWYSLPR